MKTQLVLVEAVSMFAVRYLVEVPVGIDDYGNDKALWALDTVACQSAKEFSQKHIAENIISHRVVSMEEAINTCDIDNDYCKSWSEEEKIRNFFTLCVEEQEEE